MAISSDVKLYCYNEALRILKSRALSSVTEATERRRVLDSAWGTNNEAVQHLLEMAGWNFAMRSVMLEYDPSVEPAFGLSYACAKPDDFVRLETMSGSDYFWPPMSAHSYTDEAGYWFSDVTPLYVRFVSNGDSYGMNSGLWPMSFKKLMGAHLAEETCFRITGSSELVKLCMMRQRDAMKLAKSRDVMDEGSKMLPPGSWVRSRGRDGADSWRDRR